MESNNYEWFISQTVEAMLPRFSSRKIGLGMIIEMSWHYYGEEDCKEEDIDYNERHFHKKFVLFFHRSSNYIKVLLKDISDKTVFYLEDSNITMTKVSDHDSCWRTDGLSFIFKAFVEAWEYFEQFEIEGRKIDPSVHYSIFSSGKPTYYKIKMEKVDPNAQWGKILYNVDIGEKIPLNKISEYMQDIN